MLNNKNTATSDVATHYSSPASALNRIYNEAPYYPRCSDNKTAVLSRPRETAINYPYMQVNRKDMVSWLVFDLDHPNCLVWEDRGLPAPNIVVSNRQSGKSHLFYAITPVCTSENARSKPIQYMRAIYEAFSAILDADPSYSGPVAKTPGHPWWKTWEIHNLEYSLGELSEYIDLPKPSRAKTESEVNIGSRHCILFEDVRHYAYSIVSREREQSSYDRFFQLILAYAEQHNNFVKRGFSSNLSFAQVKATAKSVSRWTWDRYTGSSNANRGIMKLPDVLSVPEKQKLAAKRTHDIRRNKTKLSIHSAYEKLISNSLKVTQVAISKLTGLSRQTIAKYLPEVISECIENMLSHRHGNSVNYGANQITTALSSVGYCVESIEGDLVLLRKIHTRNKPPT